MKGAATPTARSTRREKPADTDAPEWQADTQAAPMLSIVVPCFNEEAVLGETASRLMSLLDRLVVDGAIASGSRLVLVDDGSRDQTWSLIERLAARDERILGIKLSRNHGHQRALLAGLLHAPGDCIVSIDADLQDDIAAIEQMLAEYTGGADIVYGVRSRRTTDSLPKRFSAELYYRVLAMLGVQVVFNHADFRLLSRRAVKALADFGEVNLFLRGMIPMLGFPSAVVTYERRERFAGESKYPVRKMLALAWDGVTSFSTVPLRVITGAGAVVAVGSLALAVWALWTRVATDQAVPGWASTVIPIVFLGGVQLLSLGIIGEYVAKIFLESKRRPRFTVDKIVACRSQHFDDVVNA